MSFRKLEFAWTMHSIAECNWFPQF